MKAILFCIIGTILFLCFANPTKIGHMISPTDRISVEQATDLQRVFTGQNPRGVPVIVVGSCYEQNTVLLEGELNRRGIAFNAAEITSHPSIRDIMNKVGSQETPTTIVGTHLIAGCKPDEILQTLIEEQKSGKWPLNNSQIGRATTAPERPAAHTKTTKRRHGTH